MESTNSPKVTIITACYNRANSIEKTIQSVLDQTYPNIEYLVIDGGSTDDTLGIIEKYRQRLAYFISEKDNGISDAWNKALEQATGDIIGIINSDDWYEKQTVEKVVNLLQENPDAGFVFGDLFFVGEQGNLLYKQKGDPDYTKSIRYEMPSIPHPTVFVRKSVYDQVGFFDTNLRTAMDYEFLLRITLKGIKGIYLPEGLAYMRLGGESDINCYRGYHEVYRIATGYGFNKTAAFLMLCFKCIKIWTRKKLQWIGLEKLVRCFRKHFNKRYSYEEKNG